MIYLVNHWIYDVTKQMTNIKKIENTIIARFCVNEYFFYDFPFHF